MESQTGSMILRLGFCGDNLFQNFFSFFTLKIVFNDLTGCMFGAVTVLLWNILGGHHWSWLTVVLQVFPGTKYSAIMSLTQHPPLTYSLCHYCYQLHKTEMSQLFYYICTKNKTACRTFKSNSNATSSRALLSQLIEGVSCSMVPMGTTPALDFAAIWS